MEENTQNQSSNDYNIVDIDNTGESTCVNYNTSEENINNNVTQTSSNQYLFNQSNRVQTSQNYTTNQCLEIIEMTKRYPYARIKDIVKMEEFAEYEVVEMVDNKIKTPNNLQDKFTRLKNQYQKGSSKLKDSIKQKLDTIFENENNESSQIVSSEKITLTILY